VEAADSDQSKWPTIAKSPLLGVYVSELHWLAVDIVNRSKSVFDETTLREDGRGYIKVNETLHADIYAALGSAAKIRALIQSRPKRRRQSAEAYGLLKARCGALSELLEGIDLEVILDADVRHSIEHFDERIDEIAEDLASGSVPPPVRVPVDMAVSHRWVFDAIEPDGDPKPALVLLRVYVADERVFVNARHEIDLGKLATEAAAIADRTEPHVLTEGGRGAPIVIITDRTFTD
jgi:hypothetical protein